MNTSGKVSKLKQLRLHFEQDLFKFAKYVNPHYAYGDVHENVFGWLSENIGEDTLLQDLARCLNKLLLLPRGHLKSHCIAVFVTWVITKFPWLSVIYVSANDELTKAQVYAIQNMLTSKEYQRLWPEMVNPQMHERDKWSQWAISVDHPERKKRRIRDFTLVARTIKGTATGLHCDLLVLDDVVTDQNAYTQAGRKEVRKGVAAFTGIKNPNALTIACGTRYHPDDVYHDFEDGTVPVIDDEGHFTGTEVALWEILDAVVEDAGDGTGNFLWPRTQDPTTKAWFGFDIRVWAQKRAEYLSLGQGAQFWAQYYNRTNDPSQDRVDGNYFIYFDQSLLSERFGRWYYDGKVLNIFGGVDLAFSDDTGKNDWSAIAVIGVDWEGFIYILHLDQYKTTNSEVHFTKLINLHDRYHLKKVKIETNNAGKLIDQQIRTMLRTKGRTMNLMSVAKTRHDGSKLERYAMTLEPRYEQGVIYHCRGGFTPDYEEQVRQVRPVHDDLKDAVTDAIDILELPARGTSVSVGAMAGNNVVQANNRFGGRIRRRN